ncbi:MAG TPA: FAD-dependent oxidoreductase [Anaerolineales bacterium]|nr:FAD-dependent oxidoreductase [Anaerolineales bacterium]
MTEHDLRRVAFPILDDVQVATLAKFGTRRTLSDGQLLFKAGARDYKFFVVERGAVEIVEHSSGEAKMVTVHEVHGFGGDVSLVTGRPALISAVARGDTEVFEIPPSDLRRIMGERPALGELLLRAFIARRELLVASDFQGLRVLGAGSSRDTFRIRDFLARNQVPFTWIDMDHDPQVGALLLSFGLTEADTPVVVFGSEPLLRNPSTRALADLVGVRRPLTQQVYDLVIVGGGPAGLAAAVYGSSEGLATVVVDATAPGGQAGTSSMIENYLGFPTGISGADLASRAILQAQKFGAQFSSPSQVVRLEFENDAPVVCLDDGQRVLTQCVLVATGADYRRLNVPGREQFEGLGVYYAATQTEAQLCRGSEVVVIGGGNSAGQAVMFLSEHTSRVLLLLREGSLRKSMSNYLAERIEGADNVEVLSDTQIVRMLGGQRLEAVEIMRGRSGESRTVLTPAVFTFIGAVPCTGWLPPEIETDSKGFIKTGRLVAISPYWTPNREPFFLETSHPGIFAAGDVRLGSIKRVASAVGEGAMAVKFVHEYLSVR